MQSPTAQSQSSTEPVSLERLQPVAVVPKRYIPRPQALAFLERIESVGIQEEDPNPTSNTQSSNNKRVFMFDVCFKLSQSRLPVSTQATRSTGSCTQQATTTHRIARPDIQVARSFRELRQLRDEVYYAAYNDHGLASSCGYCQAVIDFILVGSSTPRKPMQFFQNRKSQCKTLTSFVQELLRLAVDGPWTLMRQPQLCRGQQEIPEIVHRFLQSK